MTCLFHSCGHQILNIHAEQTPNDPGSKIFKIRSWPTFHIMTYLPCYIQIDIGGSRGRLARRTPPYGTQFFCFRIHFHWKVPMSEVHAPPNGCTPPYGEILDPPLIDTGMWVYKLVWELSIWRNTQFKSYNLFISPQKTSNTWLPMICTLRIKVSKLGHDLLFTWLLNILSENGMCSLWHFMIKNVRNCDIMVLKLLLLNFITIVGNTLHMPLLLHAWPRFTSANRSEDCSKHFLSMTPHNS